VWHVVPGGGICTSGPILNDVLRLSVIKTFKHVSIFLRTWLSCLNLPNIYIWISLAIQKPFIAGRGKTAFIPLRRALTSDVIAVNSLLPVVNLLAMTLKFVKGLRRLRL
jgi:hypothetical protein